MRRQFRRVLFQAVRESEDLTLREKRRIRAFARIYPGGLRTLEEFAIDEAIEQSKLPETQLGENIDWDALLEFLKELLPIILEIIMAIIGAV